MGQRLEGKVALVTGIGAGIGRGIAMMFAREGATVIGCDIAAGRAEGTLSDAKAQGLTMESVHPVDLTKPDDVARYIEHVASRHGYIDILVNAAAIPPHMEAVSTMDYERQWVPTLVGEVDLVFLTIKAAWPYLEKRGGSIINFASVSAFRGSTGAGMVAHCAGKAAILGMSRQIAIEGGPSGIRCNTIAPGLVRTASTDEAGTSSGSFTDRILQRLIIKRIGEPDDIAYCAVYLASDEAKWVTGANFSVDGGVTAA